MMATGTPDERKGCGVKEATRIVFRGRTRRLFLCSDCVYKGNGAVHDYATEVPGKEREAGSPAFTGPARRCGDETS